jgi:XTP/dITP diphosphohydrolase
VFQPDGNAATFGELSASEKHGIDWSGGRGEALSHRARAFLLLTAACLRKPEP